MALRSVLGKLGNKCIYHSRKATIPGAFRWVTIDNYKDREVQHVLPAVPSSDIFHSFGDNKCGVKVFFGEMPINQRLRRTMEVLSVAGIVPVAVDDPEVIAAARYAVEECNRRMDVSLQFVRVVMASQQAVGTTEYYYLTLEAVDANVVKVCNAIVQEYWRKGTLSIMYFAVLLDNGGILELWGRRSGWGNKQFDNREQLYRDIWNDLKIGGAKVPYELQIGFGDDVNLSDLHKFALQ